MNVPRPLELVRAILPVVAILVLVVMLLGLLYATAELFLLLFIGVLLALLLRAVARPLEQARIPTGLAFAISAMLFFSVVVALLLFFGPPVVNGFTQLAESLPGTIDAAVEHLEDRPNLRRVIEGMVGGEGPGLAAQTLLRLSGVFSTVVGAAVAVLVVVFTGFYLAAEAHLYRAGALKLVPPHARKRAHELLDELSRMLTAWLFGQFMSMATIGVLTWLGLLALGVPMASTLALAAALLTFIPTIGPVMAAIPAVLVGFSEGPLLALYVVVLYIGVETLESYLITPLVQRQVVHLPPVLVLAAQLLLAVLYGLLGLFVAAPLTVLVMVLTKRLYVEDILGDRAEP